MESKLKIIKTKDKNGKPKLMFAIDDGTETRIDTDTGTCSITYTCKNNKYPPYPPYKY